jgi:DNA-binding response OmpR family regulator
MIIWAPFDLGELLARIKALVPRGQRSRYADFGGVRFGIEYSLRDSPLKAL